ncbi:Uncharacterised protein [Bordetella pertussis]|nr:Uncharacterised protein [Bordetella pertussis]
MKKCSRRNSVGPMDSDWLWPDRRWVTGSSFSPATSMMSSVSCGARRRSTALMRAISSLGEKGLVM